MEKKLFLTSMMISVSSLAFSQVGINIPTPTSTLDVTAKNATGTTSNVDGLLIPRVTRERAQSMASVPTSTLIYVNEVTTGTQTLTAVNIDSVGHYFFNGTVWVKLNTSAGVPLSTNIYNSDGALNSNRVVTQGTNKLQFDSSTENGLFTIDAANNRIGVGGVTAPDGLVEIVADNKGSGAGNDFYFTGYGDSSNPALFISSSGGTRSTPAALAPNTRIGSLYFNPRLSGGWPFTSSAVSAFYKGDGTTNLTNLSFTTSTIERMMIDENGNVGIGIAIPHSPLQFANAGANRKIVLYETANNDHQFYGFGLNAGTLRYQTDGTNSDHVFYAAANSTTSNELMRIKGTGNVGIGTNAPTAKLHIAGGVRIEDGSQGANKILTSDANGLASWKNAVVDNTITDPFSNPYLLASGGTNIAYAGGAGWTEGAGAGVNCMLNEAADPHNVYDPTTGIVTISENGFYFIRPEIAYSNVPGAGSTFDGTSGKWDIYLNLKANGAASSVPIIIEEAMVTRGISTPSIAGWYLDVTATVYLKVGDQISVTFHTYGTNNMNANTNNIIYRKSASALTIYKF